MIKNNKQKALEMKLISDIVWGWDLGKTSWMSSLFKWRMIIALFSRNFIVCRRRKTNVVGDTINPIVGYSFIVPIKVKNEEELIKFERKCSHFQMWKIFGKKQFFYLSEIILHSDYRNTKEFLSLCNKIVEYCVNNGIETIYTTAVSKYSRRILSNKKYSFCVSELAVKEENRTVYKIDIVKYYEMKRGEKCLK